MAKQWACKCGHINEPDDPNFSLHKCIMCGRDKWLPYYIGGGSALAVIVLVVIIVYMLRFPESAYRSKFRELYKNNVLGEGGSEITLEEREQLTALKRRFKLSEEKIEAWEKDEIEKAGHDIYRDTFRTLYTNEERTPDGKEITQSEREQLKRLASEHQISQALTTAFEKAIIERFRPLPKELAALLHNIYVDEVKTNDEQGRLDALIQRYQVNKQQIEQLEQDIRNHWQRAKPYFDAALDLAKQADYLGAVDEFQRALNEDSDNAWIQANMAAAYIQLGRLADAQSACERAEELDPKNWLVHYNFASLYAKRNDCDQAARRLSEALRYVAEDRAQRITKAEVINHIKTDRTFNPCRNAPRFQQLLAQN
ncbi:MAG: tetratricopeptide repeat protein [Candidatus Methanomethylicaceae archaeon]